MVVIVSKNGKVVKTLERSKIRMEKDLRITYTTETNFRNKGG